jgi:UDP-N-acetylmuramoylalanine--D-glutamate ligase
MGDVRHRCTARQRRERRQAPLDSIAHQSILVLGLGDSGLAAAELAICQGATVTVLDADDSEKLAERAARLENRGVKVLRDFGGDTWSAPVDLAIISPGIHPQRSLGRLAARLTCPVISELEFGFRYCSCPILAITGTNGKTTTTELTVHCLKGAGKKVIGAGNIGLPLAEAARKSANLDFIVAEVSSFQLERVQHFTPLAAALLNITPDHLDRYGDMATYLQAKLALFRTMASAGKIVLQQSLLAEPAVQAALPTVGGPPVTFASGAASEGATYRITPAGELLFAGPAGPECLLTRKDVRLLGDHNLENIAAALALCRLAGVDHAQTVPHARKFAPSAHRLELVAAKRSVKYINDSKATNPDALIQALKTVAANSLRPNGKVLLIAGGRNKQMDFTATVPYLRQYVKAVFLIGESKDDLAELWQGTVPCAKFTSLAACVDAAIERAQAGDVVLLSPGCASQDMFANYAERGNLFSQEVRRRLGE